MLALPPSGKHDAGRQREPRFRIVTKYMNTLTSRAASSARAAAPPWMCLLPEQVRPQRAALLPDGDGLRDAGHRACPACPERSRGKGRLLGTQQVVEYQEEARHGGVRSHQTLTYDHTGAVGGWAASELPPAPSFKKLEESVVVEEEYARLTE
jgi:hypothetical protein